MSVEEAEVKKGADGEMAEDGDEEFGWENVEIAKGWTFCCGAWCCWWGEGAWRWRGYGVWHWVGREVEGEVVVEDVPVAAC